MPYDYSQRIDVFDGIERQVPSELAEALRSMPLVDHHVHGHFTSAVTRAQFEACLNEGSPTSIPDFMSQFDSQVGFAVRRWCGPVLDLEPHAEPDAYWSRRETLGVEELTRRMLRAAGVKDWVIDTGFSSAQIASVEQVVSASEGPASRS